MKKPLPQEAHVTGTYVFTCSVLRRIQFFKNTFKVPDENCLEFTSLQEQLINRVRQALPNVSLHVVQMADLVTRLSGRVEDIVARHPEKVVVSICPDTANVVKGEVLHINRLFDWSGDYIGHGARPGSDNLAYQIESIIERAKGKPLIIVEDGVFTGNTLNFVLKQFESRGSEVSDIVIGFCRLSIEAALKQGLNGRLSIVENIPNIVEWIPDHDLLPLIPYTGRTIGVETPDGPVPFRSDCGTSFSFPYILPFGRLGEWASIPESEVKDLSKFCLRFGVRMFDHIQNANLQIIRLGDIISNPRVSLPLRIGDPDRFEPSAMSINDYLRFMEYEIK